MQQYDFRRGGKKCAVSEELLLPGEVYVSALVELPDGQTTRVDYSLENFDPDGDYVGSWKQQVPELDTGKVYWAPTDVLLNYFRHQLDKKNDELTFVMSLLLIQKRILQHKDSIDDDDGTITVLADRRSSEIYEVRDMDIDAARIELIQQELAEHLFSHQLISAEEGTEEEPES